MPGPVDETLVTQLRNVGVSAQTGPVIITYHDIGHNKSPYTVTPEDFATQMRLIHDAGWTTLTADQVERWLDGQPVPAARRDDHLRRRRARDVAVRRTGSGAGSI